MRRFVGGSASVLAAALLCCAPSSADDGFPYVAYVVEPDSQVRSGPGEKHYATMTLPAGFAVEVYRHDGDAWCAIRPPEGSFSLVDARNLRLIDENLAEVVRQDAPSRVGSAIHEKHNAVQVLLGATELVEVLEPLGPTDQWARISPPSGEFRWIAASLVSRTPPVEGEAPRTTSSSQWSAQSPFRDETTTSVDAISSSGLKFRRLSVLDRPETPKPQRERFNATARPAAASTDAFAHLSRPSDEQPFLTTDNAHATQRESIEFIDGSPAAIRLAQHERPAWADNAAHLSPQTSQRYSAAPPATAAAPPIDNAYANSGTVAASPAPQSPGPGASTTVTPNADGSAPPAISSTTPTAPPAVVSSPPRMRFHGYSSSTPVDERVFELQLQLSQLIVQPPSTWRLGPMRSQAAALLAELEQPEQKRQVEQMLTRLTAFENAQLRYTQPWMLGAAATSSVGAQSTAEEGASAPPATADAGATGLAMTGGQADAIRRRVEADLAAGGASTNQPTEGDKSAHVAANDITPTPVDPFVGASDNDTKARYDAVGTLKPVVSKRQQAPRYALVDDDGQVVAFLTPRPDLNLQRFVGQRIGVHGPRGFMPEFRRAHVTASRITPLDDAIVR